MLSYPYIEDAFRAILSQSKAIQGRFFITPFWMAEINQDNLGQLVVDSIGDKRPKDGPIALMMPPASFPTVQANKVTEDYRLRIFFLKTSYMHSSGAIQDLHKATNTSTHRVVDDWHDMKRVALAFMQVLKALAKENPLREKLLPTADFQPAIQPVSTVGDDRYSGVQLTLAITMAATCGPVNDYPADWMSVINIPIHDTHPEHSL